MPWHSHLNTESFGHQGHSKRGWGTTTRQVSFTSLLLSREDRLASVFILAWFTLEYLFCITHIYIYPWSERNLSFGKFLYSRELISACGAVSSPWCVSYWVRLGQKVKGAVQGDRWLIWKALTASEVVSCICIYVYVVHIYFGFSPPSPTQAAEFDMCSIVWS